MHTAELSLLESIGDYACKLIEVHPSLRLIGQNLSIEDLGRLTSVVQNESNTGKPVRPPTRFVLEVKRVVAQKAWQQLTALLAKWRNTSQSQADLRLSVKENEYLTMGLLWQTLLITKCHERHDAIQEKFAAIRNGESLD